MKKKLFSAVLIAAFGLSLAACGSKESPELKSGLETEESRQTEEIPEVKEKETEETEENQQAGGEADIHEQNKFYIANGEYDKVIIDSKEYCDKLIAEYQLPVYHEEVCYNQDDYTEEELSEIIASYDENEIKYDTWWNYDEEGNATEINAGYKTSSYRFEDGTKLKIYDGIENVPPSFKAFIDENNNIYCLSSMSFSTEEGAASAYALPYDLYKVIEKANEQNE